MTREDIIRMAREALGTPYSSYLEKRRWDINDKQVAHFAALVAAAEREACAKVCEEKVERSAGYGGQFEGYGKLTGERTGSECAAAIRARGEE